MMTKVVSFFKGLKMILTDVIPATSPRTFNAPKDHEIYSQAVRLKSNFTQLDLMYNDGFMPYRNHLSTTSNKTKELFQECRTKLLSEFGVLPADFHENDNLTLAAQSPRLQLSEIKNVADKLGFVFIPWSYMRDKSYSEEEGYYIKNFVRNLPDVYTPYVLCPVVFYDVKNTSKQRQNCLCMQASKTSKHLPH